MLWKRVTSAPVTTERSVRVYRPDKPEIEGYVAVAWSGTQVRFYGSVRTEPHGGKSLDDYPTFG